MSHPQREFSSPQEILSRLSERGVDIGAADQPKGNAEEWNDHLAMLVSALRIDLHVSSWIAAQPNRAPAADTGTILAPWLLAPTGTEDAFVIGVLVDRQEALDRASA